MSLRRLFCNCRLRTRITVFSASILLVIIVLLYRALLSHDTWGNHGSAGLSLPREHRRGSRFHSKMDHDFDGKGQILRDGAGNFVLPNEFQSAGERDLLSVETKEAVANFLSQLYPTKWSSATETDEMALELKHLLADYGLASNMSCKEIDNMKQGNSVTFSRTKNIDLISKDDGFRDYVQENYYHSQGQASAMRIINSGPPMVVKTFNGDTDTKIACMKEIYDPDYCGAMGNYRLLREILLLSSLRHSGIIVMKGACLRGSRVAQRLQDRGLILITEAGTTMTQGLTHGSSWSQQLWMSLQISRLLIYLDSSPVGSLRFTKLDLKDFVLVRNKDVKLVDLDDLELGERTCSRSSDCEHAGRQFPCSESECVGLNSYINLDLAVKNVFLLILSRPTPGAGVDLVSRLGKMELDSVTALTAELQMLLSQASPVQPLRVKDPGNPRDNRGNQNSFGQDLRPLNRPHGNSLAEDNTNDSENGRFFSVSALNQFDRYNRTNFPGIFDYPCTGSRVTWGCFHTVSSLREAATMCVSDPQCKCFITFSSKPDSESLMTVVMKNNTDLKMSRSSSGTTLFVRRSPEADNTEHNKNLLTAWEEGNQLLDSDRNNVGDVDKDNVMPVVGRGPEHDANSVRRADENEEAADDEEDDEVDDKGRQSAAGEGRTFLEISECLDGLIEVQAGAHSAREKRLMTHLGLKGVKEQMWRRSAQRQELQSYTYLVRTSGGGGQFTLNLTQSALHADAGSREVAKKATFIAEDGPNAYHMAYATVYHLDRILGFFHTPPVVGKQLSEETVSEYQSNAAWYEIFRQLIASDGTLTGILVPPTPRAMKVSKLLLKPLEVMTSEVVPFERQQKLQLEYVVLWWLGRMEKAHTDHLGYKGHLIHFGADHAFTNTSVDLSGYLYHCQFPNVIYKSMGCFRCQLSEASFGKKSEVCSLGEETALRATAMFPDELELYFHQLQEDDIILSIDSAASSILTIVDRCIKLFGRRAVLY